MIHGYLLCFRFGMYFFGYNCVGDNDIDVGRNDVDCYYCVVMIVVELILVILPSLASQPHVVSPFSKRRSLFDYFGIKMTQVSRNYRVESL